MIYAILINGAENVGATYFSHFYTGEGNEGDKIARQQAIIRKVIEDKSFQQQAASFYPTRLDVRVVSPATLNSLTTSKKVSETYPASAHETSAGLPQPNEGVVLLSPSPHFRNQMAAVWHQFGDILFTLVCEQTDNLVVMGNTLLLIIEHVARRFGVNRMDKHITEKPDEVEHIVCTYLRLGYPLLVNHSLHRFIAKAEDGNRPYME
jgi:hypothetical protein